MGREQRRVKPTTDAAKTPRRLTLPETDYWKFRASVNDLRAIELEATRAAAQFQQRLAQADQRTRALFAALGKTYGFDPAKTYAWDDTTHELIEVPGGD